VERGDGGRHVRRPAARRRAARGRAGGAVPGRRRQLRGLGRAGAAGRRQLPPPRPPGHGPAGGRSLRREVAEGLRWLWDHPLLRTLALLAGGIAWLMSVQYATFVLYAQEVLRLDARGF
jgi:hypothetical protein